MKKISPITPSTGGLVTPSDVVGRDEEIAIFWGELEKQGIALFAERRFGKSSILRKMADTGNKKFITLYVPIEGVATPEYLSSELLDRVKEMNLIDEGILTKIENYYNKAADVLDEVKGVKFKKLEHTWQKQLFFLLNKLIEKHKEKFIVIMLDEFSIFLNEIENDVAASIIGFLRNITYEDKFKNIRFVYCGSIGIDLVLEKLKKDGQNIGDPLNHMYKHELQTFTNENALYFGKCLNLGCNLKVTDEQIKLICKKANNIPYFIDYVFDKLSKLKKLINDEMIECVFEDILNDTKGKASIKHFYDRIGLFYPNPEISIYILNFVSKNTIVTESEIANNILANTTNTNRIKINEEIERLMNDGYLIRVNKKDEARAYNFKYSLLKSWWKINKAF